MPKLDPASSSAQFARSLDLARAANHISAELPQVQEREGDAAANLKQSQMVEQMEASNGAAALVSDDYLGRLHQQLVRAYRDQLVRGQQLYIKGLLSASVPDQMKGAEQMQLWGEFWEKHGEHVTARRRTLDRE